MKKIKNYKEETLNHQNKQKVIDCFVAFQRKNHMRLNLPTAKFIKNKFIADKKYIDYITKLLKRNENYLAIDSEDDDFYFLASFL